MAERSIFFEEWRASLREHYKYVVRREEQAKADGKNPADAEQVLETLKAVLLGAEVRFTEAELHQLERDATMHVDDMPDGYLPRSELMQMASTGPHPAECACPACVAVVDEAAHDDEGQPLPPDEQDKTPRQLSLFDF